MDRSDDDDELDDGGGRAALVIGFGDKADSELPDLMRALARSLRDGDWDRAARAFKEAMHVCDDTAGDERDEHDHPHKSYGGREKNGDRDDDLMF